MTLAELILKEKEILEILEKERLRHACEMERLQTELLSVRAECNMILQNLDVERMRRGEKLIGVTGDPNTENRKHVVREAIVEISKGGGRLKEVYLGTKNYAHFIDQPTESAYGFVPKHGHVVFRIGLRGPREQLSPNEIEDAIYYLSNLEKLQ
jgi:hypothetical protein